MRPTQKQYEEILQQIYMDYRRKERLYKKVDPTGEKNYVRKNENDYLKALDCLLNLIEKELT